MTSARSITAGLATPETGAADAGAPQMRSNRHRLFAVIASTWPGTCEHGMITCLGTTACVNHVCSTTAHIMACEVRALQYCVCVCVCAGGYSISCFTGLSVGGREAKGEVEAGEIPGGYGTALRTKVVHSTHCMNYDRMYQLSSDIAPLRPSARACTYSV